MSYRVEWTDREGYDFWLDFDTEDDAYRFIDNLPLGLVHSLPQPLEEVYDNV